MTADQHPSGPKKGAYVSRVRIWISEVRAIGHAFIIEHDDGRQESYPLKNPPAKGDRLRSPYRGDFRGFEGTYYDLPFGFPTSNELAEQRLSDPSIPAAIKKLIQENFPLPSRPQALAYSR